MEVAALGLKVDGADGVERASNALNDLTRASDSAEKSTDKLTKRTGEGRKSLDGLASSGNRAASIMSQLGAAALKVGAMIGVGLGINAIRKYADEWSDMQSVVGASIGNMSAAAGMMNRIVDIANASYSPLQQTVDIYSRNVSVLQALGKSSSQAADFTESLNHMLVLTATRGERAASVQNALSKAMAVGKLQADGLETVLANGGEVAKALATELGTTVNGLRQFATDGKITGQVIANSIIKPLEDVRERAGEMPATMADAGVILNNVFTELVGKIDKATGASSAIAGAIISVAEGFRTAGQYILAFGAWAEPVFSAVGAGLTWIGQYADIALAAVGGFAAPALIAGVGLLASALATGLVSAIKLVTAAMLANPIGLLVGALAAAAVAVYKFRDDIKAAIGVDVVAITKTAANFVIGSFVAAYEDIKFVWNNFGDMMGAAVVGGINIAIRAINKLIQGAVSGVDTLISAINKIPGIDIKAIGSTAGIKELENPYSSRLAGAIAGRNKAVSDALSKDYIGAMMGGFNLPETSSYSGNGAGGGAGGGNGGAGGGGGATRAGGKSAIQQAAEADAKALQEVRREIELVQLAGEELAQAKARDKLSQYATPEQVALMKELTAELYRQQQLRDLREKIGDDPEKYIRGTATPGDVANDPYASYQDDIDAENQRYADQLTRLTEVMEAKKGLYENYYSEFESLQQKHNDRMDKIETASTQMALRTASDGFGALAGALKDSQGEQSAAYKAMFAASKAFAAAEAALALPAALAKAWTLPWPANIAALGVAAASMATIISSINAVTLAGQAHDGIMSIPEDGTWNLKKGERVTTANTSAKLDSVLERIDARQRAGRAAANDGAYQKADTQPVTVNIHNAPAGTRVERRQLDRELIIDVMIEDEAGGGRYSQARDGMYGLQRVGR